MFKFRCLMFQQRIKVLYFLQYVSTREKDVARHGKSSAAQAWNVSLPLISTSSAMLDMNIIKSIQNGPNLATNNPGIQLPNPGMDRLPLSPLSHGNLVSKCSKDLNIK